jgi:ABC-type multidrug transport system ATPase subunit
VQQMDGIPTVASTFWDLFTRPFRSSVRLFSATSSGSAPIHERPAPVRWVLTNVSGVIRPGTLTLVLAPPGHGKSAFLKALSLHLPNQRNMKEFSVVGSGAHCPSLYTPVDIHGRLSFSGATPQRPRGCHLGQLVQYVSQLDVHLPHLTVEETISFVYKNAVVNPALHGHPELGLQHEKGVEKIVDFLHLNSCKDTIIGNDMERGVSGGERKRVTVAEGLASNAQVLALDEISTGLDSDVAYKIVSALKHKAAVHGTTVIMSLLQPQPELFSLFDEVVLLREGSVVFHGPVSSLFPYIQTHLGYTPPRSYNDATSGDGPTYDEAPDDAVWLIDWLTEHTRWERRGGKEREEEGAIPPDRWPQVWQDSALFKAQMASPPSCAPLELITPFQRAQYAHPYTQPFHVHLWLLIVRQFLLMVRSPLYLRARFISCILMAFIMGVLYYQRSADQGATFYGTFLNAAMFIGLGNITELATAVDQKYIAYKHVTHGKYSSLAFVLAGALAHIPVSILVCTIFAGITYSMAGLAPGAGHFIFFVLICFLIDVFCRNLMAMFAYASKDLQTAQTAPAPVVGVLMLFAGFFISPNKMGWMKCIYYMDVFGYALRALALNEFLSERYNGPPVFADKTLGILFLEMFGFETGAAWMWFGVAFSIGACIVIFITSYFAFTLIRYDPNIGSHRDISSATGTDTVTIPLATAGGRGNAADSGETAGHNSAPLFNPIAFEPMTVVFRDIHYAVKLPKRAGGASKTLLRGISGYALPGRVTGLMGASGTGKTTLLDVLAGRKSHGLQDGTILLNGRPKDEYSFSLLTAYVEQNDLHTPLTTVREAVEFSASLRLPACYSTIERRMFVDEVLELLELTPLQHRLVGKVGDEGSLVLGEYVVA